MAISTREFTENICITFNGRVYTIIECFHITPIKGPAMVRTKLRDIKTGEIRDNAFNAAADVMYVDTEKVSGIYAEDRNGAPCITTDTGTIEVRDLELAQAVTHLSEGEKIALVYVDGTLVGIEPFLGDQTVPLAVSY